MGERGLMRQAVRRVECVGRRARDDRDDGQCASAMMMIDHCRLKDSRDRRQCRVRRGRERARRA